MSVLDELEKARKKAPSKIGGPKVPETSILNKIKNDPRFSQTRSAEWFRQKINELGGNTPTVKTDLLKTTKADQTLRPLIGAMYIYKYNPLESSKESMPAYDTWPLTIVINLHSNGFSGLNLHYLGRELRRRLFEKIWAIAKANQNDQQRCARLTWKLLGNVSKFPEVIPTVHRYLYSGLQSKMIRVPMQEWIIALHMPLESFSKKSFAWVARNSGQQIKRALTR